ncbi:hypothetical protein O1L55_30445 [Streptomyces albulus]|nr:hypothetical protein [Streptomyces noursei]
MIIAVWLPLVMPLLAVPTARRLAESLPPRAAAWLLACCAATLAACTAAALGLLAAAGRCGCRRSRPSAIWSGPCRAPTRP